MIPFPLPSPASPPQVIGTRYNPLWSKLDNQILNGLTWSFLPPVPTLPTPPPPPYKNALPVITFVFIYQTNVQHRRFSCQGNLVQTLGLDIGMGFILEDHTCLLSNIFSPQETCGPLDSNGSPSHPMMHLSNELEVFLFIVTDNLAVHSATFLHTLHFKISRLYLNYYKIHQYFRQIGL